MINVCVCVREREGEGGGRERERGGQECTLIFCFDPETLNIPSSCSPLFSKNWIISLKMTGTSALGYLCWSHCHSTDRLDPNCFSSTNKPANKNK